MKLRVEVRIWGEMRRITFRERVDIGPLSELRGIGRWIVRCASNGHR